MEDVQIIALFFAREEDAIREAEAAYGAFCRAIAGRILPDPADAEEIVADTWLHAWNAIPPNRPERLGIYLGRITRNLALTQWRKNHAQSRGGGQVPLALEELSGCVSGGKEPEAHWDAHELAEAISAFLRKLPQRQRQIFLRRYYYLEDIRTVANRFGISEGSARMTLSRVREKLRQWLIREGFDL